MGVQSVSWLHLNLAFQQVWVPWLDSAGWGRAINSGRLSVTETYTGDYQIDPAELNRVFSLVTERATTVSVKRDAVVMEQTETALMQAQIDRLFQVGELIRNELENDRNAWSSQADRLRQLVG